MTVEVHVVTAELDQYLGMVRDAGQIAWSAERTRSGTAGFQVPSTCPSLLIPGMLDRDCVFVVRDSALPAWPGHAALARLPKRQRGDTWDAIKVSGVGVRELLRQALVEYARGVGVGVPSDERPFGWMAVDYDDTVAPWLSPPPYSGGLQSAPRFSGKRGNPPDWPDPQAEWYGAGPLTGDPETHPVLEPWYSRAYLIGSYTGPAVLFITADGSHTTYYNGAEILREGFSSWRDMTQVDVELSGFDVLASEVTNGVSGGRNPTEMLWTIGTVDEDTGELLEVLFRSESGAVFGAAVNDVQQVIVDYAGPDPGYPDTFSLIFRGNETAELPGDATAAAVESALNALPTATVFTVTGAGTSADPYYVTATDGQLHPTMTLIHDKLIHNHGTAGVVKLVDGRAAPVGGGGSHITVHPFTTTPPGVTLGWILAKLFDEWIGRGGTIRLSRTFDAVLDTHGVAWPTLHVLVAQVGNDSVLSCAERWQSLGVDVDISLAWGAPGDPPTFTFDAWVHRGQDRPLVEVPLDVAYGLEVDGEGEKINALLVRTADGWWRYPVDGSPAADRREAFLALGLQPTSQTALGIADAVLASMRDQPRRALPFSVRSSELTKIGVPVPGAGWTVGDRIVGPTFVGSITTGAWALGGLTVDTLAGRVLPNGDVEWTVEVVA